MGTILEDTNININLDYLNILEMRQIIELSSNFAMNKDEFRNKLTAQWLLQDTTTRSNFSGTLLRRRYYYICSNCHGRNAVKTKYCPRCGYFTGG